MRSKYRVPVSLLVIGLVSGSLVGCSGPIAFSAEPTPPPYEVPYISPELDQARKALFQFFTALHEGHYDEAVEYYGGDYQVLRDWNPDVPADDYAWLFENGCTVNGLQCVPIQTIDPGVELPGGVYQFKVGFVALDGSMIGPGPQFTYTLHEVDGKYLVQELPVYVP